MRDLCSELSIGEVPDGVIFEEVPSLGDIPRATNLDLGMLQTGNAPDHDFYEDIVRESPGTEKELA